MTAKFIRLCEHFIEKNPTELIGKETNFSNRVSLLVPNPERTSDKKAAFTFVSENNILIIFVWSFSTWKEMGQLEHMWLISKNVSTADKIKTMVDIFPIKCHWHSTSLQQIWILSIQHGEKIWIKPLTCILSLLCWNTTFPYEQTGA